MINFQLIFKKSDDSAGYKELEPDPEFRRVVFNDMDYNRTNIRNTHKQNEENNTKLGEICLFTIIAMYIRSIYFLIVKLFKSHII